MDYFSDLSFVCYGSLRKARSIFRNHYFDGYYGLQFIRSGSIRVSCDGVAPWQTNGPVLFITGPGKRFSYCSPEGSRDQIHVCFRGDRVRRYIETGLLPFETGERILITAPEELSHTMESIIRYLRRGDSSPENHGNAVLLLEKALLLIQNQPLPDQGSSCRLEGIRCLAERIAEHPEKKWDFLKEAAELNLSEVHFRRLFQREHGSSPLQFVLNHRIDTAAQLLVSTDMLIKEIAFECGFGGEFYFSR